MSAKLQLHKLLICTAVGRSTLPTVEKHSSDVSRLECTQILPAVSVCFQIGGKMA